MIRPATQDDMMPWLEIRNDPLALFWSGLPRAITPSQHAAWFDRTLASQQEGLYVVEREGKMLGYGRVQQVGLVSLAMAPSARGQGLGGQMLQHLEGEARRVGLPKLLAVIHPGNTPSLRAFARAGYAMHPMSEVVVQRVL